MTYFEKIKAMSVEELAAFLESMSQDVRDGEPVLSFACENELVQVDASVGDIQEWLEQKA